MKEKRKNKKYSMDSASILIVDDEKPIVEMTKEMLEHLGYKPTGILNPIDALNMFEKEPNKFDLVITDMTMPAMTGDKLSEKLLKIKPNLPIILCTGYSNLITEEKAKKIGIAKYVMKPFSVKTIANSIKEALTKRYYYAFETHI